MAAPLGCPLPSPEGTLAKATQCQTGSRNRGPGRAAGVDRPRAQVGVATRWCDHRCIGPRPRTLLSASFRFVAGFLGVLVIGPCTDDGAPSMVAPTTSTTGNVRVSSPGASTGSSLAAPDADMTFVSEAIDPVVEVFPARYAARPIRSLPNRPRTADRWSSSSPGPIETSRGSRSTSPFDRTEAVAGFEPSNCESPPTATASGCSCRWT
jgi:hypothetical protein